MSGSVTLRHGRFTIPGKRPVYFYEGVLVAEDNLLTIPVEKETWWRRAWMTGWNLTPDGERLWTFGDLQAEVARQSAPKKEKKARSVRAEVEESAESAGEEVEDSDSGRQPEDQDRVREGQSGSGDSVPE